MELGKSEALIEQAANELISKKLKEGEAPAFTNAYDDDDLGIANIDINMQDTKQIVDSQGQEDGFDDYNLSVGSRGNQSYGGGAAKDNTTLDQHPYQNLGTEPTRNEKAIVTHSFGRAEDH